MNVCMYMVMFVCVCMYEVGLLMDFSGQYNCIFIVLDITFK